MPFGKSPFGSAGANGRRPGQRGAEGAGGPHRRKPGGALLKCPPGAVLSSRFIPRHEDELELDVDDPILVELEEDDYWYRGYNMRTGERGIFPAFYAHEVVSQARDVAGTLQVTGRTEGENRPLFHCSCSRGAWERCSNPRSLRAPAGHALLLGSCLALASWLAERREQLHGGCGEMLFLDAETQKWGGG